MKTSNILVVFLCLLFVTGCETASRNCEGFHHPLAEIWTGNDGLGETRSFADSEGNSKSYIVQTIEQSGPRVATSSSADSNNIPCIETAKYLYVQSDADISYEFDFLQRDVRVDLATEDQSVSLAVSLAVNKQNPAVETRIITKKWWDLWLNTTPVASEGISRPSTGSYLPEATINGQTYVELLQHTFVDNSEQSSSGLIDEEAQWVRMLIAKGFGLIQYELFNGTVYTLVR